MTAQTDLDTIFAEKGQREDAFEVRAALERATNTLTESLEQVQAVKDSGNFDLIKPSLKAQLNNWNVHLQTALTSIGNSNQIQEILNWRP